MLDLSLPLCRGRLISSESGKQVWVGFKYERLLNLCYWCERLTLNNRDYELWIKSEGTLKIEDRQFGLGLRAPAFVMSRKLGLTVQGYYKVRKKTASSSSHATMEMDILGQSTVNLREMAEQGGLSSKEGTVDKSGGNHDSGCNGNPGINDIKVVPTDLMRDRANDKILVLTPQIVTDMNHEHSSVLISPNGTLDMNHQEVVTSLNSINAELAGFESPEESSIPCTKANTCATISSTNSAQLSVARDLQKTARVSNLAPQRRVLPTWIRKVREANNTLAMHCEQIVGRKRDAEAEGRQPTLPFKRQQVYHGDNNDFLEVVKAVDQPRQTQ